MTVVAILGSKHSPGATTLAVALGAVTSADDDALVVEADPAGGDVAARAGLPLDPGLLTLAAAGRRGLTAALLDVHTQRLANGTPVLVAPSSPEHAHAAVRGLAGNMEDTLRGRAGLTIVDVGRWDPQSPASEILRSVDVIVAVFRPTVEGVEHLRTRLAAIPGLPVVAVMVGEHPYRVEEVRSALGLDVVHVIADDPRAAMVGAGASHDRWLRRSAYVRSVTALRSHIVGITAREVVAS
ncbi:MAG: hypothetical protein AB7V43_10170 [Acidimicrobiia bacterium]